MSTTTVVTTPRLTASSSRPPIPLVALVRAAFSDPNQRLSLFGAAASAVLLLGMFRPNLAHFLLVWSTDENYSHGFLVPLISLYFANEAARRGPVPQRSAVGLGTVLILSSILGRLATVLIPVGFIGDLSFIVGLTGIAAILFGLGSVKRYGFALFFLIFMIPLPVALYAKIASPLQLSVSRIATALLNLSGIPALCEGNMITLPGDNKMFVAEACSGMRQLTGFLALTAAWAYLTARPLWYRGLLVASSIPIAMTANVVRVTLTGAITYRLDPKYASGAFHTAEGLLMMGFGLFLLTLECRLLDAVAGFSASTASKPPATNSTTPPPGV